MARPKHRAERKAAILNFRVTEALKEKLEAEARISGRTLAAECETRLWESMEESEKPKSSPETRELLEQIERHIAEIEHATGTAWNTTLGTWAAVQEMMEHGPIMAVQPSKTKIDEEIADKLAKIGEQRRKKEDERRLLIEGLRMLGVQSAQMDLPSLPLIGALWLGEPTVPSWAYERQQTEANAGLPEDIRQRALDGIDRLEALDAELLDLQEKQTEAVRPLAEAIEKGRSTYERPESAVPVKEALALLLEAHMQSWTDSLKPARRRFFGKRLAALPTI